MSEESQYYQRSPFSNIGGILMLVVGFVLVIMLARGIFWVLQWLSPLMLIATLILDYRVITGFAAWLLDNFKKNPFLGIGTLIISVLFFPITIALLLGKALFKRELKKRTQEAETIRQGEWTSFEEVKEEFPSPPPPDPFKEELPPLKKKEADPRNPYDNLFE